MKGAARVQMWAVMRDGKVYMILPNLEGLQGAETYLGLLSKNGTSKHKWGLRPVTVILRMLCEACGTLTGTGRCDCTKMGTGTQRLVPYRSEQFTMRTEK